MVEDDVFQGHWRERKVLLPQDDLTKPHERQDHGHLHALDGRCLPHTLIPVLAFPAYSIDSPGHLQAQGAHPPSNFSCIPGRAISPML